MGQKVHPIGFRIGVTKTWNSKWYAEKEYARQLHEDLEIRAFLRKKLKDHAVSKVLIERAANKAKVYIHSAKPGSIIGRRCAELEKLKADLQKITNNELFINVNEVRKADMDAQLVADNIARQLEKRVSFRRAMKKAMTQAMKAGAKGIRINCSGRLGGAEMARREQYRAGRVPLHTLRADIDFALAEANTTFGRLA